MRELDTIELFVDEENQFSGVEAISLVENPAIEENFVALKAHKVEFKTINEDKRIIVGLLLYLTRRYIAKVENTNTTLCSPKTQSRRSLNFI